MKRILLISLLSGWLVAAFSQQITNVQFTTMKGKKYDLYELLNQGKYVAVHATRNS
jgi:hypothetical protein